MPTYTMTGSALWAEPFDLSISAACEAEARAKARVLIKAEASELELHDVKFECISVDHEEPVVETKPIADLIALCRRIACRRICGKEEIPLAWWAEFERLSYACSAAATAQQMPVSVRVDPSQDLNVGELTEQLQAVGLQVIRFE